MSGKSLPTTLLPPPNTQATATVDTTAKAALGTEGLRADVEGWKNRAAGPTGGLVVIGKGKDGDRDVGRLVVAAGRGCGAMLVQGVEERKGRS